MTGAMEKFCRCLMSAEERAQKDNSAAIDNELRKHKAEMEKELKLLLLGTGESGKSTFIKQMKIIHGQGFNQEDQIMYRRIIKKNIVSSMQNMVSAMDLLFIRYEHESNATVHSKTVNAINCEDRDVEIEQAFTNKVAEAISLLWKDSGIQLCYDRRREYQLTDSAKYFFDALNEIVQPNFVPSEQDILRSRVPTEGINEYVFRLERVDFRIIDVGGQRKERRKWIQCFEHVTSIIFLSALSEYDLVLQESANQNRMEESLHLFRTIICYPWFQRASVIIFLNKTDVFEEKIRFSRITDYFPQYTGDIYSAMEARDFVLQMFRDNSADTTSEDQTPKPIYSHFTCATDTQNIKFVFNCVRDHILHTHLKEFNLV
ncbi:guanine nucleotide-binding protein subunit alpha-14-like [Bolinopsis microptera]|uniref:guanine nucleotide-binding protein subunit alpha-14-like n=1 Tax=Bolinopsis microptera TaxID=2820187 RepID=UPI00307AA93E